MNAFNYMTNEHLARAITTTKQYIKIDTGYSCAFSAGRVTFTNNYTGGDDSIMWVDLADQTGLHGAVCDLVNAITNSWTRNCYYHESFATYLWDVYTLTEAQYKKLLKWSES